MSVSIKYLACGPSANITFKKDPLDHAIFFSGHTHDDDVTTSSMMGALLTFDTVKLFVCRYELTKVIVY